MSKGNHAYASPEEEQETITLVWENLLEAELRTRRFTNRAVRWRRWRRWADFSEVLGSTSAVVSLLGQAHAALSASLIGFVALMGAAKEGFRVSENAERCEVGARTWTDRTLHWGKIWAQLKMRRYVDPKMVLAQLDSDVEANRNTPLLPFNKKEILRLQDDIEFLYSKPKPEDEDDDEGKENKAEGK
jgi:hypothetical protein